MVENSETCLENELGDKYFAELEGTTHLVEILVATKGAVIVSLQLKDVIFKGVLLDVSNLSLTPSVVTLPKPVCKEQSPESCTVIVHASDSDLPEHDITTSACQFRHTYHSEHKEINYRSIIPSRHITSSIHRLHNRPRLRNRSPKRKLYLCSMCKTHCMDSDNNSDKDSTVNLITPPIKISFKAPNGHSVMEIEPKHYKKSSHKRRHSKHKSKKHSKKFKYNDLDSQVETASAEPVDGEPVDGEPVDGEPVDGEPVDGEPSPTTASTTIVPGQGNASAFNWNDDDSDGNQLVIDIPGEHANRRKKKVPKMARQSDNMLGMESPPSAASDVNAEPKTITKTKARLRRQKTTPKVNRAAKAATVKAEFRPYVNDSASVASEMYSRDVSTYEGQNGKRISVGDVIWGKIIGFPWWPGRVCAITVSETQAGIILDHTADIDWYCSPTKSHLSCSLVYPFLEEFAKRFDKKKKTKSYTLAVNEAKCDAVMNAQYVQATLEPDPDDQSRVTPDSQRCATPTTALSITMAEPAVETTADTPNHGEDNSCNIANSIIMRTGDASERGDSPSLLIDAFLRTSEQSDTLSNPLQEDCNITSHVLSTTNNISDDDSEGCVTISLPSPQSLLNAH